MALTLGPYTAPAPKEAGDSFRPSDHVGDVLIVKVLEFKTGIVTQYKPDGGDGVTVDICNLTEKGALYQDVLWMNGALVDGLKAYTGGQPLVVRLIDKQGAKNTYIALEPGTGDDVKLAEQYIAAKGDPFVKLATPAQPQPSMSAAADAPPWARGN